MAYLLTKSAHLVFVIAWMATVFYLPRILVNLTETRAQPDVQARLATLGMEGAFQPHDAFGRFLAEQRSLLTRIAIDAGLRPE